MVQFMNYVSETLNKKQHAVAIFCDLRKAFDTCNHTILFKKMEKMGIRGLTLDWFKNYLTDRKPYCELLIKLLFSKKHVNFLHTIFSSIFEKQLSKEIGL